RGKIHAAPRSRFVTVPFNGMNGAAAVTGRDLPAAPDTRQGRGVSAPVRKGGPGNMRVRADASSGGRRGNRSSELRHANARGNPPGVLQEGPGHSPSSSTRAKQDRKSAV